jgi:hypothetical protein
MTKQEIIKEFELFSNSDPHCHGVERFLSKNGSDFVFKRLETLSEKEPLNYTQLNQLFVISELNGISEGFYKYYWVSFPKTHPYRVDKVAGFKEDYAKSEEVSSVEHLRWGFYRIYIDTLFYFGNISLGFYHLSRLNETELKEFFESRRFEGDHFAKRGEFIKPTDIPTDDRYLISEMACKTFEAEAHTEENLIHYLTGQYRIAVDKGVKRISVRNLLTKNYSNEADPENKKFTVPSLFEVPTSEIKEAVVENEADIIKIVTPIAKRFARAREAALANTHYYLSMITDLDIYVATSMRNKSHFDEMAKNCVEIFHHHDLKNYYLRYFDPTLSAAKSHEDKGIIECLMVRSAKILVYTSGDKDSYGKDVEAAMALSSGKPVVFFCPDEERYRIAREVHPLTKLIDFKSGVANGAIIVKTTRDVVAILKRIVNDDMEYTLVKKKSDKPENDGYFKLVEVLSGCDVRIQTNDSILSKSFWNYFDRHVREQRKIADVQTQIRELQ